MQSFGGTSSLVGQGNRQDDSGATSNSKRLKLQAENESDFEDDGEVWGGIQSDQGSEDSWTDEDEPEIEDDGM